MHLPHFLKPSRPKPSTKPQKQPPTPSGAYMNILPILRTTGFEQATRDAAAILRQDLPLYKEEFTQRWGADGKAILEHVATATLLLNQATALMDNEREGFFGQRKA